MNTKALTTTVILVLIVGNLVFGVLWFYAQKDFAACQTKITAQQTNTKIIDFAGLVVEKVLKAQGEVSFDDRLQLENMVRETKDSELLAQWNKFTSSKDEGSAQQEMKNLLGLIIGKLKLLQ